MLGLGAGWAFALDAVTFLVSAVLLTRVRPRERGAAPVRRTLLAELREGYDEVRSRAWIWVTVAVFALALMLSFGPWTTLGPTIAEEHYGSTGVFGLLAAAMGAGTMLGALVGFRWRPLHPMRVGFVWMLSWPARDRRRSRSARRCSRSCRCSPRPASAWRCSGSGGRRRWPSACRRTRSRASPPTTGWARSRCCRSATCSPGRWATRSGPRSCSGSGSALATLVLAAGLAVRETWTLRRLEPARALSGQARSSTTTGISRSVRVW